MTPTDATEDAADAQATDAVDAEAGPPARPKRRWLLVALGALVLLALIGLAVVQTLRVADRDAAADDRHEVAAAAGALAEALLTYDYHDVEAALDRVEQHIGGDFADVYAETFRTVQVPVITQLQAVATAEVIRTYVTDIDDDTASAVVVIDQTVQSTAGTRSLTGTYLQMDLVKRHGAWVVETIPLRVSSENETLTPNPGDAAATTTTTATTTATTTP